MIGRVEAGYAVSSSFPFFLSGTDSGSQVTAAAEKMSGYDG
jgi:hypothetical protein